MSYSFHYVRFAKEDRQRLTGSHLSLLFQASEVRKILKRDVCALLTKGLKQPQPSSEFLITSFSPRFPAFLQAAWKICKDKGAKNIPRNFADFYLTSPYKSVPFPLVSTFVLIHFQGAILFIFFATMQNTSVRQFHLPVMALVFNFLTNDLSYFYNCVRPPCTPAPVLLVTASHDFYLNPSILFLLGRL